MDTNFIRYELKEFVGLVFIDRPEFRNALSTEMWRALPVVLDTLRNSGARAIVLGGAGGAFASGADLTELKELHTSDQANRFWSAIEDCLNYISDFSLPVVAMIDGACVGGGCLLASACDLRYASERATFAVPVARLGIILDDASIARLVSIVGDSFTRQMLFTGWTVSAAEAIEHQLIDGLFESENLLAKVLNVTASIVKNDPTAVSQIKLSMQRLRQTGCVNNPEQRQLIIDSYLSPELRKRVGGVLNQLQQEKL
jgi:enoyl-CoA hydratase/carnithine racemase